MTRSLFERRVSKSIGGGLVHLNMATGPDDRDEYDDEEVPCCMAGAMRGPRGCTCWTPVYDLEQVEHLDLSTQPQTRSECCFDCAYRPDSPERADGYFAELVDVAVEENSRFLCHQGMRRVIEWRHPDGRVLPAGDGDYQPPMLGNVGFKADGSPADLCAGWSAHRATAARTERRETPPADRDAAEPGRLPGGAPRGDAANIPAHDS